VAEADPQVEPAVGTERAKASRRKKLRLAIMLAVPLALLVAGVVYWLSLQGKVSTDNAYVRQDKVSISAQVNGKIVQVLVHENEMVKAGQLLFRIDPESYQIDLAEANAAIATAQADVTARSGDAALSGADIAAAREDIAFAEATLRRQQALWERGFTTKADLEAAEHAVAQAREDLRVAEADRAEARAKLARGAAVPGEDPRIAAAKAQHEAAQLDLSRTEIRAPMDGKIGQANRLQPGQQVIANVPVLTLVATQSSYVEANFKETDLADMKVGQPAKLTFDAYPGVELKGHVQSIGAGTNSEFSILPAQNAGSNWIKVTQRVPVRIAIDEKSPRELIAGLSTIVTVYTDGRKH
jgi:membrane fusion protein (multidrug efflux system)